MECLCHPNVMSLTGISVEHSTNISIVMPRMKTSLLDYLRDNRENLRLRDIDHKVGNIPTVLMVTQTHTHAQTHTHTMYYTQKNIKSVYILLNLGISN